MYGRLSPLLDRFRQNVEQIVQHPRKRRRNRFPYTCAYQTGMEAIDSDPGTFEPSCQLQTEHDVGVFGNVVQVAGHGRGWIHIVQVQSCENVQLGRDDDYSTWLRPFQQICNRCKSNRAGLHCRRCATN